MNDRDDLERRLASWLEDTGEPMPAHVFDEIVAAVPNVDRTSYRAAFGSVGRWPFAFAGVAAALVLAIGLGFVLRPSLGPGTGASAAPSASVPVSAIPASPSASPSPSPAVSSAALVEWHRNNFNAGEETLTCRQGTDNLTCTYQVPNGTGSFVGQLVTESWSCPAWFPSTICSAATTVYRGVFLCCLDPQQPAATATPGSVTQEYVITMVGGQPVLQLYWVDRFVCPWYRTSAEALAADFNCVNAPGWGGFPSASP